MPERQLHIKPGATDVVFVFEDRAEEVKNSTNLECCLSYMVGQAELKTSTSFSAVRPLALVSWWILVLFSLQFPVFAPGSHGCACVGVPCFH